MKTKTIADLELNKKIVVMRVDLNVPVKNGVITGEKRIKAVLPTIRAVLDKGAGIILLSHLGRPEEGVYEEKFSLRPVAVCLAELLGHEVKFHGYDPDLNVKAQPGEIILLENVRFLKGEKKNSPELAKKYASLGDVFIMDAFGTAHRAQATTEGVIQAASEAAAGPLMIAEMDAATRILDAPQRPLYAIVGGSKVSTKLTVLENLIEKVDGLIVGGGIANTFLLAEGVNVGNSLTEPELVPEAKKLLDLAKKKGVVMPMPKDAVTAKSLEEPKPAKTVAISEVGADDCIFDIGPETVEYYSELLANAKTIVWNGPVGAFETEPFDAGTKALAERIAGSDAYSVICGGDTVTAVENMGFADKMSYLSTGGGAFLEVLEGKTLPAVAALAAKA